LLLGIFAVCRPGKEKTGGLVSWCCLRPVWLEANAETVVMGHQIEQLLFGCRVIQIAFQNQLYQSVADGICSQCPKTGLLGGRQCPDGGLRQVGRSGLAGIGQFALAQFVE